MLYLLLENENKVIESRTDFNPVFQNHTLVFFLNERHWNIRFKDMLSNLLITLCLPFYRDLLCDLTTSFWSIQYPTFLFTKKLSYTSYSDALVGIFSNNFMIFARVCSALIILPVLLPSFNLFLHYSFHLIYGWWQNNWIIRSSF